MSSRFHNQPGSEGDQDLTVSGRRKPDKGWRGRIPLWLPVGVLLLVIGVALAPETELVIIGHGTAEAEGPQPLPVPGAVDPAERPGGGRSGSEGPYGVPGEVDSGPPAGHGSLGPAPSSQGDSPRVPAGADAASPSTTATAPDQTATSPALDVSSVRVEVATDRQRYTSSDTVLLTVSACNDDPDLDVRFQSAWTHDLEVRVSDAYDQAAFSWPSARQPLDPPRSGTIAAGSCLTEEIAWEPDPKMDADGDYVIAGWFTGTGNDGGGVDTAEASIELSGSSATSRDRENEAEQPWSLSVSATRDTYQVGDDVVLFIELCNHGETEQTWVYPEGARRPFTLDIRRSVSDHEVAEIAHLSNGAGDNGSSEGQELVLAPGTCHGWDIVWRGTEGNFDEDGTSDGHLTDPGDMFAEVTVHGPQGSPLRNDDDRAPFVLAS